jgi:hypothetical protein
MMLLALMLLVSMLAACGGNDGDTNALFGGENEDDEGEGGEGEDGD